MKTIYFVRHGESEVNLSKTIAPRLDSVHLTNLGVLQAKKAGRELKDKDIQIIVSSPMIRTLETARYIAAEIGYDPKKIVTNKLFTERGYGIYHGGSRVRYEKDIARGQVHASVESQEALYKRVKKGLKMLKELKEERILLVSHRATGRAVRVIAEGLHHSHMYKIEGFNNSEIYEFAL